MELESPLNERELLRRAMSIAGSRKSDRKTETARENGKKGGRPLGTKQSEATKQRLSDIAQQRASKAVIAADAAKRPVGRPRTQPLATTPARGRGRPRKEQAVDTLVEALS